VPEPVLYERETFFVVPAGMIIPYEDRLPQLTGPEVVHQKSTSVPKLP
jgi:hypothetical protein